MRIVKAGHPPRVPHGRAWCLAIVMAAGTGCSILHPNQPTATEQSQRQSSGASDNRDAMAALLASTMPSATEPSSTPPVVTETPTSIASTGPTTSESPATEPSSSFLPGPNAVKPVTSNGAEFAPRGETIHVDDSQQQTTPLQFSALVTYLHGGVNGSLQIPKGGRNGTSNGDRPRLNGMGIDTADIPDVEVGAKWDANDQAFLGAQFIKLDGAANVPRTLVSDGVTFPKGGRTNNAVRLDWYRLGYRHTFNFDTAPNGVADITLTPQINGVLWDFGYNYRVRRVGIAHRSLDKLGVQIGGTVAWRPDGGPFSVEAFAATFPQIRDMATISVESIFGTYHFYEYRRFDFTGRLGVEWEQQAFRDNQKLPNRININFGPMLLAGLEVRY